MRTRGLAWPSTIDGKPNAAALPSTMARRVRTGLRMSESSSSKITLMPVILGSGAHRYRVVEDWAQLPEGWEFKDVAAVACDSKDRVYAFNRGEHPMMVFDREGRFLRSWGEGSFPRAHGLHIDANDILYLTDDGGHV